MGIRKEKKKKGNIPIIQKKTNKYNFILRQNLVPSGNKNKNVVTLLRV